MLSAGIAQGATAPGMNGKIVFAGGLSGTSQIYTVEPDGSSLTRLTVDGSNDVAPAWSPDGTRIAFSSDRDGDREIFVMNADGSDQHALTVNTADDSDPAWSPDGSQIAFTSDRDGDNEIFVMNADGTGQTQITTNTASDTHPDWAPSGTTIAFDSDRDGNLNVYRMAADGTTTKQLTSDPAQERDPSYSPDGLLIAFTTNRYDTCDQIAVIKPDGSGEQKANNAMKCEETTPDFAPSGSRMVWSVLGSSLWIGPVGGGDPFKSFHQITPEAAYAAPDWQAVNARLSISAASTVKVDASLSFSGRLTFLTGSPASRAIDLYATPPGGSPQLVGSATTDSAGRYVVRYVPKAVGGWTFETRYAGDGSHQAAAHRQDVQVLIRTGALTISASSRVVRFGHSVVVTAHLGGWHTNREVTMYQLVDGVRSTIEVGNVNRHGNLSVTLRPTRNMGVSVTWAGDDWYTSDWARHSIPVRVAISGRLAGYTATTGKYRVYPYRSSCPASGSGCPRFTISVRPNHAGMPVGFTIQEATPSGWEYAGGGSAKLKTTSTSTIVLVYRTRVIAGHRFRILAGFDADDDHWGAKTPWRYFTIT
jgi:WD40 repeat protein